MVLNYIWIAFFVIAFVIAVCRIIFTGDTGVLSLWLGFMKIGERGGVINFLSRMGAPVFSRLFPEIPKGHAATGSIFMNIAANMLNLDNAATPLGLKAMKELQELNPKKDTASNSMIMFIVLNASGLIIVPVSIMVYRAQMGSANPAEIFMPLMIATTIATLVGALFVCIRQKINLFDKVLLAFFGGAIALVAGIVWLVASLPQHQVSVYSSLVGNGLLFGLIIAFLLAGVCKKINVYDAFIEGAKDGFKTAVTIIPFLIAMLVAIALFRVSGAMTFITDGLSWLVSLCGLPTDWVNAVPTALMKPLSGNASRGMMLDAMQTYGPDSFVGRLVSVVQGSTDTTFYIVAVYYGAVGIKNTRYTIPGALLADLTGAIAAIFVTYLFFT